MCKNFDRLTFLTLLPGVRVLILSGLRFMDELVKGRNPHSKY